MHDFINMGGYGLYVWPSYGLGAAVLAWNIWSALRLQRLPSNMPVVASRSPRATPTAQHTDITEPA